MEQNKHSFRTAKVRYSTTGRICNISHYNFMQYTFIYKAIIGSLLLCKIQLVPLVFEPSFLRMNANRIVSIIMDLYRS
jgi:hypothetical protein